MSMGVFDRGWGEPYALRLMWLVGRSLPRKPTRATDIVLIS